MIVEVCVKGKEEDEKRRRRRKRWIFCFYSVAMPASDSRACTLAARDLPGFMHTLSLTSPSLCLATICEKESGETDSVQKL